MTTNYSFRILARLPDHAPVELHRSTRVYHQTIFNQWTRGMDPAWSIWVEHFCHRTITPRVAIRQPKADTVSRKLRLYAK